MLKRRWKRLAVLAALLAAVVLCGLWYTRPLTIRQLCPEIDISRCSAMTLYHETMPDAGGMEPLTLTPDSPAFAALLEDLETRTFSRSLPSLLPGGTRTARNVQDGDFQWWLQLEFDEPITTPDGNGHSGKLIELRNFFGQLMLSNMVADRTWDVTTKGQEEWTVQVMDWVPAGES